ncbi:DUF397 domain-containing protein [Streptomyces sp. enrichment culture]|uniref:DUF397 domain-containing protein n=1 Tax=Streptomyces sp. enrichment culture TaxID=1795815 RepID=UPI003F562489
MTCSLALPARPVRFSAWSARGGARAEVADAGTAVLARDPEHPDAAVLNVPAGQWTAFVRTAVRGWREREAVEGGSRSPPPFHVVPAGGGRTSFPLEPFGVEQSLRKI